jgi:hypothetical protein
LGGKEEFLRNYREHARNFNGDPNAHVWEFGESVFTSLTLSPEDMRPDAPFPPVAEKTLTWLLPELGRKGVLNPW